MIDKVAVAGNAVGPAVDEFNQDFNTDGHIFIPLRLRHLIGQWVVEAVEQAEDEAWRARVAAHAGKAGADTLESGLVCEQRWSDAEPDTLRVAVHHDGDDGKALVTFTCSSTWLSARIVRDEVMPWIENCCDLADHLNGGGEVMVDPYLGHRVVLAVDLDVDGVDFEDDDQMDRIAQYGLDDLVWTSTNGQVRVCSSLRVHEDVPLADKQALVKQEARTIAARVAVAFPAAVCGEAEFIEEPE
jgi:hypothetical protein